MSGKDRLKKGHGMTQKQVPMLNEGEHPISAEQKATARELPIQKQILEDLF